MGDETRPEFVIGPVRQMTMSAITYFHAAGAPVAFASLDQELDRLLEQLYQAKNLAQLGEGGPDITRYYEVEGGLYVMEVGISAQPGTQPAGMARVKTLPPYRCAGLLLWGGLQHTRAAYEALHKAMAEAGLERSGECREWNYWFEAVDSPHNLMGIYQGVR